MKDHSPPTAATFRFTGFDFDDATGIARLGYALEDRHGVAVDMVEEILFPMPSQQLTQPRREAFLSVLRLVHLVAGMSYYKAGIPPKIEIDGAGIDSKTARLA